MEDQKKTLKELGKNDVDKPSYKALVFIEGLKLVFVLMILFLASAIIHALWDSIKDAIAVIFG